SARPLLPASRALFRALEFLPSASSGGRSSRGFCAPRQAKAKALRLFLQSTARGARVRYHPERLIVNLRRCDRAQSSHALARSVNPAKQGLAIEVANCAARAIATPLPQEA